MRTEDGSYADKTECDERVQCLKDEGMNSDASQMTIKDENCVTEEGQHFE